MIMVSTNTKKNIVGGIVVLGLLGLLVVVSIHLWYKYGSSSTNSSSINRSIANFTEVLNKERVFYLPVLAPTSASTSASTTSTIPLITTTTTTTTAAKLNSGSNRPFVLLNNYSDELD